MSPFRGTKRKDFAMTRPLKTNRDGSINTAHYIAIGRQARSDAAADLFRRQPTRGRKLRFAPILVVVLAAIVAAPGLV